MFLSKQKNGYYYLYYQCEVTNKRRKISTGETKRSEALKFLTGFKQSERDIKTGSAIDLNELQAEVMKYVTVNLRNTTTLIYKRVFNEFIRHTGNRAVKLITIKDVEQYKSNRLKAVAPASVNIELMTLKAIFNIAIRFNWSNENPVKYVKKLAIPEKSRLSFTEGEINTLLSVVSNPVHKRFIEFALLTGCRLNEILNIQIKDIDQNEQVIYIRNKENFLTKSGKERALPISNKLNELITPMLMQGTNIFTLLEPEQYLFNNNGFKYNKDYITHRFKRYLRKANLSERFCLHCLRHTYITNLIRAGVSINHVKELAGHSDIKTTMNYIHLVTEDLRQAVEKI